MNLGYYGVKRGFSERKVDKMTKDEKSLLLFLETRAVDYAGRVNAKHMNESDFNIAIRWDKEEFIMFGRIRSKDINSNGAYFCRLTDKAMKLAHNERLARSKRMWKGRSYSIIQKD